MDGIIFEWVDGCMDRRMDGKKNDGWMDLWMIGCDRLAQTFHFKCVASLHDMLYMSCPGNREHGLQSVMGTANNFSSNEPPKCHDYAKGSKAIDSYSV